MNEIIQENAIVQGRADSSYWDVAHSTEIEGFATDMSVNAGSRVDFKININGGAGSDYKVEIFRLGYYGGSGAREVADWTNTNATVQPEALVDASRGMVDAGNWSVTDGWNVPTDAVSGFCLVTAGLALGCHLAWETTVWPGDAIGWVALVGLGIGPVGAAFFAWDHGVKRGDIRALGALSYASPLLSTLLLIGFGLTPGHWTVWAACGLIVSGALLASHEVVTGRRGTR